MRKVRAWILRLGSYFNKRRQDRELDDEIESHLQLHIEDNRRLGMTPEEARRQAMIKLGGIERTKEAYRDQRGLPVLDTLWQDIRYGTRMLRKNPGFTAVTVLTLALGIGANTAIFSVLDAVLLKTLPVREPERLRALNHAGGDRSGNGFSYPIFERLRDQSQAFSDLFAFSTWPEATTHIQGREEPLPGGVLLVSGEYYRGLGVQPALGRLIMPEDNRIPGGHPVAVLSHGFWQRKFGRSPNVVGQSISLNGTSFTVIGVTPPEFFGVRVGRSDSITVPTMMQAQMMPGAPFLRDPKNWDVEIMGRLKPDLTEAQAQAELRVLFQGIELDKAGGNPTPEKLKIIRDRRIDLTPASQALSALRRQFSEPLRILMAVTALVLLIACANVANLLLSRGASRQKEIVVRLAIGAGRRRLFRQLLTESLLLAALGGAVGLLFAKWVSGLCVALIPDRAGAIVLNLSLDARMLAFTATISVLTGILFGLLPAWQATRINLSPSLKESAGERSSGSRRFRFARGLVVVQVALSLVLLIASGLFVRTFQNLKTLDPGFVSENLLLFSFDSRMRGSTQEQASHLFKQLLERLGNLPGVLSATVSRDGNFGGGGRTRTTITGEGTPRGVSSLDAFDLPAGPRFFETFGVPLLQGREFTFQDDERAPKVGIINQTAARAIFGSASPIGRRIGVGAPGDTIIVGVAKDTKLNSLREEMPHVMYRPFLQTGPLKRMTFAVRTAVAPMSMLTAVRRELDTLERDPPVFGFTTLSEVVEKSLAQERLFAALSSLFGLLALTVAGVGLYGVMAHSVNVRRREIGLRIALGARRHSVLTLVIGQGMRAVLAGLLAGAVGGFGLTRLIASRLYGVVASDPMVFAVVTALLGLIALLACYLPARRAARVDPMEALRCE